MKKNFFLLLTAFFFFQLTQAQINNHRLKVFIDCSNTWCDRTFIQTEINIVDFYLDNQAADVHVLITQQQTGSGGSRYQLIFFGLNQFRNMVDTLHFTTQPTQTDFEIRDLLIKHIKLGLVPFIAKTSSVNGVKIDMKQSEDGEKKTEAVAATKDPWNYWVFRLGANGNFDADANYKGLRYSGNFSANRVTEELKVSFSLYGNKNKTDYESINYSVSNDNYGVEHSLVKSLNNHWSYGYEVGYNSSSFSNNKRQMYVETGIEYDIFPYKDINNRFFTISYKLDARRYKYYDTTIYEKTNETLYGHGTEVNMSFNQKWGSASVGISYHNYLQNWKYFNLGMSAFLNIRISGGLSFNVGAFAGLTRDQLYLQKGGATDTEILSRRRQLESGYNYFTSFGLNYRFGSKLSNFVNPRFEGGGGGMFFF